MIRQAALRSLGLVVAVVVLAAAAQYLTDAVADAPLLDEGDTESTANWVARPHGEGVEVLVGLGVVVLGVWLAYAFVTTVTSTRRLIRVRSDGRGRTDVDRRRLALAIERELSTTPQIPLVSVGVTGRGRVDAKVATPDTDGDVTADRVRAAIQRIIDERGLPCRPGRVRVRASRYRNPARVE